MWLLWWPKRASSTTRKGSGGARARCTATSGSGGTAETGSNSINYCCGLAKFTEKLKKRKRRAVRMLRGQWRPGPTSSSSKQSSLQCRYDPLSYSLNFDARGSGIPVDDEEDYYQFYAFSSRFAANPTCSSSSSSSWPSCSSPSLPKQQD